MSVLRGIATLLVSLGFLAVGVAMLVLVFWAALALPNQPEELELVAILIITMASIVVASATTALLYKFMSGPFPKNVPEEIFWASIRRYAWVAAPIASGYGLTQVIGKIGEVVGSC